ncbi:hypothetical protein CWATWH8502_4650 [Crocosphaera watsonii WH 8502]|uniref:Uncharacterized protein n=1 Tax=Crocosphaera watsonii WH 8502 TaxID=423474 RepID=T2I827_CROWT|nr:hypothetical protein CWATWH8502_4650 [Crocosphaera watsonii WH 8502]
MKQQKLQKSLLMSLQKKAFLLLLLMDIFGRYYKVKYLNLL